MLLYSNHKKGMVNIMKKLIMSVFCAFLLIFSFSLITYAESEDLNTTESLTIPAPPNETENVNSNISNDANEIDLEGSLQSSLLINWSCSISHSQNKLNLMGQQYAFAVMDQMKLTIYLQKWDGTKWVDVTSWIYIEYDVSSIIKNPSFSFYESGYYYRARAVHYAKDGSQTETIESTSSYVYVN